MYHDISTNGIETDDVLFVSPCRKKTRTRTRDTTSPIHDRTMQFVHPDFAENFDPARADCTWTKSAGQRQHEQQNKPTACLIPPDAIEVWGEAAARWQQYRQVLDENAAALHQQQQERLAEQQRQKAEKRQRQQNQQRRASCTAANGALDGRDCTRLHSLRIDVGEDCCSCWRKGRPKAPPNPS